MLYLICCMCIFVVIVNFDFVVCLNMNIYCDCLVYMLW